VLIAQYLGHENQYGFIKYRVYTLCDFYSNKGITVMDAFTCANKTYEDLSGFRRDWAFVSDAAYKRRISDDQAYFIAATAISLITMAILIWLRWVG